MWELAVNLAMPSYSYSVKVYEVTLPEYNNALVSIYLKNFEDEYYQCDYVIDCYLGKYEGATPVCQYEKEAFAHVEVDVKATLRKATIKYLN